ncbi:hypothetical protein FOZ60_000821 [Perkinsus olseni]|uniref:Uncharacterized protein n=1 Tax=Perkinsus olseni TaxID=32597 RepID=A0A7J6PLB3_PEROL|nr:hypothetical protein FOZ60_000821 [Perkinsus olseni]
MMLFLVTVCFLGSSSAGTTTLGEATIISKVVPPSDCCPSLFFPGRAQGLADALNSTMMDSLFLGVPSVSNLKARDTLTLSLDQLVKFSQKDGLLSVTEMELSPEVSLIGALFERRVHAIRYAFPAALQLSRRPYASSTLVCSGEKAVDDEGLSLKFTQEEPVQEESGTWNSVSLPTIVVAKKINRAAVMAEDATVLAFPRPSTKKYVPALGMHHAPANRPYRKSFKVISTVIVPRTWMPQYNSVTFCLQGDGRLAICSFSCGGEKTAAVLDYIPIQLPQYKSLHRVTCISYRHAKADTVEAFLDWLYDGITSSSSNGRNGGDTSNANTVFVKYFCDRLASNEESSMKFLT